jgi:hypothetical protein
MQKDIKCVYDFISDELDGHDRSEYQQIYSDYECNYNTSSSDYFFIDLNYVYGENNSDHDPCRIFVIKSTSPSFDIKRQFLDDSCEIEDNLAEYAKTIFKNIKLYDYGFSFLYDGEKYDLFVRRLDEEDDDYDSPTLEGELDIYREKNKGDNMANKVSALALRAKEATKNDLQDSLWRTAAATTVSSVKAPLLTILSKKLPKNVVGTFIKSALETPEGEAALSYLLGVFVSLTPESMNNAKLSRLGDEMRTAGVTYFMCNIAKQFTDPVMKVLVKAIDKLPDVE